VKGFTHAQVEHLDYLATACVTAVDKDGRSSRTQVDDLIVDQEGTPGFVGGERAAGYLDIELHLILAMFLPDSTG
jgi:hypothetical protein